MKEISLSKDIDNWLREKFEWEAYWQCWLSNGEIIYQDDNRPNIYPSSAWLRLKEYVKINEINIDKMLFKYRTVKRMIGKNAQGFFFSRSIKASLGTENQHYYLGGILQGNKIKIKKFQVPGLILDRKLIRKKNEAEDCLIVNRG